jgi:hypothetical protein
MASIGGHAGTTIAAHGGGYLGLSGCVGRPPVLHRGVRGPYGHPVLPVRPWPSPNHPDRSHRH